MTQLSWESEGIFRPLFYFSRGKFQVDYKVHFDSAKGTLWFEDMKKVNFIESGP